MQINDWLALNPDHQVRIITGTTKPLRAVLSGGDGIDKRIVGEGEDPNAAVAHALTVRDEIKSRIP